MTLPQKLLAAGANPNMQLKLMPPYRSVKDDRGADNLLTIGTTPLLRAAKALDAPMIELLLAHGANPHLANSRGVTPLMAAAGLGSTPIDTRGDYDTADVQERSEKAIRLLLAAGADINRRDKTGQTALHGAARWGWTKVASFLVEQRADLFVKDAQGFTALDVALGKSPESGRGVMGPQPETAAVLEKLMREQPSRISAL